MSSRRCAAIFRTKILSFLKVKLTLCLTREIMIFYVKRIYPAVTIRIGRLQGLTVYASIR